MAVTKVIEQSPNRHGMQRAGLAALIAVYGCIDGHRERCMHIPQKGPIEHPPFFGVGKKYSKLVKESGSMPCCGLTNALARLQ